MARRPRLTVPALPHHVIQRGNNRQPIFFSNHDFLFFLTCLAKAKARYHCRLYAYVLMTNHVHLLIEPPEDERLSLFMQSVGRRYVRYINETYHRTGTLWEGRFKSAVVSQDNYLIACNRYIELNPVRAGLAERPEMYPWSSYHFHAMGIPDPLLEEDPAYAALGHTPAERCGAYQTWVATSIPTEEWTSIRDATQRGLMIGTSKFQRQIEEKLNRRLIGELRGRPRKDVGVGQDKVL